MEKFVKGRNETFWALKDINLTIKKGEKVGIVGPNGSGKTTLLKIISGITSPTSGIVEINGKVVSLIDLEAGFHPDLTGEQNIFLNAMLLGMEKKLIVKNLKSIIRFADIGQFIDTPLFAYSQGMKLRLGFSVAIHANPETLILDENINAGDVWFRKRAQEKLDELFSAKKTIVVATHWLDFIQRNCKRVVVLKKGNIIFDGTVEKGLSRYRGDK